VSCSHTDRRRCLRYRYMTTQQLRGYAIEKTEAPRLHRTVKLAVRRSRQLDNRAGESVLFITSGHHTLHVSTHYMVYMFYNTPLKHMARILHSDSHTTMLCTVASN
jgi:hypothetical protein